MLRIKNCHRICPLRASGLPVLRLEPARPYSDWGRETLFLLKADIQMPKPIAAGNTPSLLLLAQPHISEFRRLALGVVAGMAVDHFGAGAEIERHQPHIHAEPKAAVPTKPQAFLLAQRMTIYMLLFRAGAGRQVCTY